MKPYTVAVAGRYAERHTIKRMLAESQLFTLGVTMTASWLDSTADADGDLSDAQAWQQLETNVVEILNADLLLYVPSWDEDDETYAVKPVWSPGRCIDVGVAIGSSVPVLIVGTPEPSIYFRGMPSCGWETVRETVAHMMDTKEERCQIGI